MSRSDDDADGRFDSSYIQTYTYDSAGNLLVRETDSDGDGSPNTRYAYQYNFDTKGQIVGRLDTVDYDVNGTPDSKTTTEFTYDARGNIVLELIRQFSCGTCTTVSRRYRYIYAYDSDDNRIREMYEYDFADGRVNQTRNVTSYDSFGNVLSRVSNQIKMRTVRWI